MDVYYSGGVVRLDTVRAAPERFSIALAEQLSSAWPTRSIIYAPPIATEYESAPATVLVVSDEGWLVASENLDGTVSVEKRPFIDTLFVELTSILLWGQMKIEYASVSRSYSAVMRSNTAGQEPYREAIDLILSGIDPGRGVSADQGNPEAAAVLESWPLHFRNQARRYCPRGERLLAAVQWPAVLDGFQRELVPAAALLVTEGELVLMADEKSPAWYRGADWSKFGGVITYFPRARLADYHLSRHERVSVLELEANARHGRERLQVLVPSNWEKAVTDALEQTKGVLPQIPA